MICCSVCTTCICAPVRHTEHTLIKLKGRHPTTTTLGQTHTHMPVHWPAEIQMGLQTQTHKHTYCQCHKKQRIWTNNISTIILGLLERDWIELQYWKKISMLSFWKLRFYFIGFSSLRLKSLILCSSSHFKDSDSTHLLLKFTLQIITFISIMNIYLVFKMLLALTFLVVIFTNIDYIDNVYVLVIACAIFIRHMVWHRSCNPWVSGDRIGQSEGLE